MRWATNYSLHAGSRSGSVRMVALRHSDLREFTIYLAMCVSRHACLSAPKYGASQSQTLSGVPTRHPHPPQVLNTSYCCCGQPDRPAPPAYSGSAAVLVRWCTDPADEDTSVATDAPSIPPSPDDSPLTWESLSSTPRCRAAAIASTARHASEVPARTGG